MRNRSRVLLCPAVLLGAVVGMPAMAAPLPTCAQLGTNPAYGLAGNPQISNLTATLYAVGADVVDTPFGTQSNQKPYCRVDFILSTACGPAGGYRVGQCQQLNIRVGLPASIADGGSGGVQGAWNGRNRDLGGGGYAGAVGPVFSSINLGYVGSSTDTGHPASAGGSFALNPDGTLNSGLILDFVRMASTSSTSGAYRSRRPITANRRPANTGSAARPAVVKAIIRRRISPRISTVSSPARQRSTGIASSQPNFGRRS
jgi:hypothetical protein